MTVEEALERYEIGIKFITRKLPRLWREDARQELRLCVIEIQVKSEGNMDDDRTALKLATRLRDFATLEYNKGARKVPPNNHPVDLSVRRSELERRIRELNLSLRVDEDGKNIIISNRL